MAQALLKIDKNYFYRSLLCDIDVFPALFLFSEQLIDIAVPEHDIVWCHISMSYPFYFEQINY